MGFTGPQLHIKNQVMQTLREPVEFSTTISAIEQCFGEWGPISHSCTYAPHARSNAIHLPVDSFALFHYLAVGCGNAPRNKGRKEEDS